MNIGEIVGFVSLGLVIMTHAVIVARWSGRMGTVIDHHEEAIRELRKIVERHDKQLFDLEVQVEVERQVAERLEVKGER